MYWFDRQMHKQPHFHARHGGKEAVFDLSGKCIAGDIGSRANRLIAEWCAERSEEIKEAWKFAIEGKEIPWITPLK